MDYYEYMYKHLRKTSLERYAETYERVLAYINSTDKYIRSEIEIDNDSKIAFVQACQRVRTHINIMTDLGKLNELNVRCSICSTECYVMVIYISKDNLELVPRPENV